MLHRGESEGGGENGEMDDTLENPDVGVLGIEVCGVSGRICVGDFVLLTAKKYIAVVDLLSFVPAKKSHKKQPKRPKGVPAYIATSSVGPGDWHMRGRWVYRAEDLPRQGVVAALGRDVRKNEVFPSMDFCVCSVAHIVGKARVVRGNLAAQHENAKSKGAYVYYNVMMADGALVPVDDPLAQRVVPRMDVGELNAKALEKVKTEPAPTLPQNVLEQGDDEFEWSESDSDENKDTEAADRAAAAAAETKDTSASATDTTKTKHGKKRPRDDTPAPAAAAANPAASTVSEVAPKAKVANLTETESDDAAKAKRPVVQVIKSADIGVLLAKVNDVEQFRWIGRPTRGTEDGPDMIVYSGFELNNAAYHAGDFFLAPWQSMLSAERASGKRCIGRILCCFQRLVDNKCFVNVEWFVMPDLVTKTTGEESMFGEIYPTMEFADVSVADLGERCRVVHATEVWSVVAWAQKPEHYWWRRWYHVPDHKISEVKITDSVNSSMAANFAQRRTSAEFF